MSDVVVKISPSLPNSLFLDVFGLPKTYPRCFGVSYDFHMGKFWPPGPFEVEILVMKWDPCKGIPKNPTPSLVLRDPIPSGYLRMVMVS